MQKSSEIPDLDYQDYQQVFDLFDFSATTVVAANVVRGATSLVYKQKLDRLTEILHEVKASLGSCIAYLMVAEQSSLH